MSGITISTLNLDPQIKGNFLKEIDFLKREGINIEFSEELIGNQLFLGCSVREEDEVTREAHEKILKHYLATIVTDLLMNEISKRLMNRIVIKKYHCTNPEEVKEIVQNAYLYLSNLHESGDISKTLYRHNQILSEVNNYFINNQYLYLEGFLRFRLKDYFNELEDSIEKSIDTFLVEREYLEFLRLLRYFVEIQEPRIDEVHVLIQNKQNFYLLDEAKQPINQEQLQGVLTELNNDVDYEDLLLSTLITISPRQIVLHIVNKTEIVDTIYNVFRERVSTCLGCELCTPENNKIPKGLNGFRLGPK